ncbi:MAG TPA: hypothetical protein VEQ85_08720, partial [Lacipirellulaceae bacterium]|nr:hypothetical protein [Lacipirellulaceae bacterium]
FGARATVLFGDYDRDGDVDGADFVVWQRGLGGAAAPLGSGADGDGNGSVGAPDLLVWGQGFGRVEGAQAAAAAAAVVAAAETPATDEASLERAFAEFDASALLGPWAYARTPARTAAPKPAPRQAFPALTAGAFRFDPPAPHAARHSAAKRPLGPTNPGEPGVEADLGQGLSGLPTL